MQGHSRPSPSAALAPTAPTAYRELPGTPESTESLPTPISPPIQDSTAAESLSAKDPARGSLHLRPSSLEEFLELPNGPEDRYHLFDGILYHQPYMPDSEHRDIQSLLTVLVERSNLDKPRAEWVSAYFEPAVAKVDDSDPLDDDERTLESCVIADVALGPYLSARERKALPKVYRKTRFPSGSIPKLIVEVTSPSNRLEDIHSKAAEYGRIQVPQYVVVDRDENCVRVYYLKRPFSSTDEKEEERERKWKAPRTSVRLCNSLPPSGQEQYRYSRKFKGSDIVRAVILEDMRLTAAELLDPQRTPTEVIASPVRRAEEKAEKAILEKEKAKKESIKKDKKIKKLMAKLNAQDITVSDTEEESSEKNPSTSLQPSNVSSSRAVRRSSGDNATRAPHRKSAHKSGRTSARTSDSTRKANRTSGNGSNKPSGRKSGRRSDRSSNRAS